MKLKHLNGAILIAVSSGSMAVPTATYDLGVLDAGGSAFEHAWIRVFGQGSTLGAFTDSYNFAINTAADAVGAIFQADYGSLNLLLNSITLYKLGDGGPIKIDNSPSTFTFNGLDSGNYRFDLAGTVTSNGKFSDTGGAYYRGTISTMASPAPEPASIAMVLAGLAAIGTMIATRRRRD